MIKIDLAVDAKYAIHILEAVKQRSMDLSPVFRGPVDAYASEILTRQFETDGAFLNGQKWKALALFTIQRRTRTVQVTRTGRMAKPSKKSGKARGALATTNQPGQARAGFARPLQNTRRLWASLVKGGGPESIRVITPASYQRGSRVPYALFVHRGFTLRKWFGHPLKVPKQVPARPITPDEMPAFATERFTTLVHRYLMAGDL